jgi:hypothetical protein
VVSPSLNVEAGRYFRGDANKALVRLGLAEESNDPLLREVGYDYANLHVGIDIGRQRMSFYIHAGLSQIRGTITNLDEAIRNDAAESEEEGSPQEPMEMNELDVEIRRPPTITIVTPSARIGLVVFF